MKKYTPEKLVKVSRYRNYFPNLDQSIQNDTYARMEELFEEEKPDLVVMGYPLLQNDDEGPRAKLSREVAEILEQESGIKVVLQDERNTTKDSEEFLIMANVSRKKRKKVIDQQAAVRILQYYLDSHKNEAS